MRFVIILIKLFLSMCLSGWWSFLAAGWSWLKTTL